MAKEIERKYLVADSGYKIMSERSSRIRQAYLSVDPRATVRIRIKEGCGAFLTVKGLNSGAVRDEWEYPVPEADALEMLERCAVSRVIDKTRWIVPYEGFVWEVDEFHGALEGLVVAEVELPDADAEPPVPPFAGREVTGDVRYYNSSLASADSPVPPRS